MLLLINNLHKKASQKVKTDEILTEHAITVVICALTTLHYCCMENALVFNPSEAHNIFMYHVNTLTSVSMLSIPSLCIPFSNDKENLFNNQSFLGW